MRKERATETIPPDEATGEPLPEPQRVPRTLEATPLASATCKERVGTREDGEPAGNYGVRWGTHPRYVSTSISALATAAHHKNALGDIRVVRRVAGRDGVRLVRWG